MEDWTGEDQMNLATLNSPDLKDSKYNAEESCGGREGEVQPASVPSPEAVSVPRVLKQSHASFSSCRSVSCPKSTLTRLVFAPSAP